MNYYLDVDPFVCAWTQELINDGLIPPGKVDCRSITEVTPDDLKGYTQHHFFNGISGWSRALALAGWPRTRPVWSASLPCQSFSCAGKGKGFDDPRGQLWFPFYELVKACHPVCIVGEQVPAAIGKGWLDRVFADLEKEGYACWSIVLGAHSVGAPQKRERLYWMAHAECDRWGTRRPSESRCESGTAFPHNGGDIGGLANSELRRCEQRFAGQRAIQQPDSNRPNGGLEIPNRDGSTSGVSGQDQWQEGGANISDDSGDRRIARERERERERDRLAGLRQAAGIGRILQA